MTILAPLADPPRADRLRERLRALLPVATLLALALGLLVSGRETSVTRWSTRAMDGLLRWYTTLAPVVIFVVLVPTFVSLHRQGRPGRLLAYIMGWLALKRLAACLFGVVVTWLVFGLPLLPSHSTGAPFEAARTLYSASGLVISSPCFLALYAGIVTSFAAVRAPRVARALERAADALERAGGAVQCLVPLFMFGLGAYLRGLPAQLAAQVHEGPLARASAGAPSLGAGDLMLSYLLVSGVVGAACLVFHAASLLRMKAAAPEFSLRDYFVNYWLKVYPLLWASCSEALATPLNLHLVRKCYPAVPQELRLFVVGLGGWLNVNGTLICVFVIAGAAARAVGHEISLLELTLVVPIVFLLGYVVPGMPGELVLFATPIGAALHIPARLLPSFIALYIGFNFGLPDSFRSGQNSTDSCVSALQLLRTLTRRRARAAGLSGARPPGVVVKAAAGR
ncbi:cation:dicarboxylase symporter family transporter [Sorangium sp. So ce834]|uniref:cation:dicarboxylate symporter family transporter n=1 Tax=Sorangium sp. So ce834 TaxID=3133321 RepID=UPI003F5E0FDE